MAKPRSILDDKKDDGFRGDNAAIAEVGSYIERILASREKVDEKKEELDELKGKTRSIYEEAKSKGLDTKALKKVVEIKRGKIESEEYKNTVNAYLKATDQLPLFQLAGIVH